MAIPTFQERQRASVEATVAASRRAQDELDVARFNRTEPRTQETLLENDPRLQRLAREERIQPPAPIQVIRGQGAPTNAEPASIPQIAPSDQQQPQIEIDVNQRNSNALAAGSSSISQVFDINSFRSEIITNDVLPAHSFLVTFSPFRAGFPENQPLTDFVLNKRNTLVLRCENVVVPTPSLLKEENIRRYGYGPVEKVAYGVQFGDISMTWIVDEKSEIIDFMHQWMNTIVSHDSPNSNMDPATPNTFSRDRLQNYSPFEVGYKDAYTNPIVRIYVYNRQNETVTEYEMYDVFPHNIQTINLAWANENEIQKLIVTFSFTNMSMKAPLKTTADQLNYLLEGRINQNDGIHPDFRRGRSSADAAPSPTGEVITTSVNSFSPTLARPPEPFDIRVPPLPLPPGFEF